MTESPLKRAYSLASTQEARDLYADWADSYDQTFGDAFGYAAPAKIASIFNDLTDGDTPVLDVGAGTGLLAEHLTVGPVDALDLSPEMLTVAEQKGRYRNLIEADLNLPLDCPDAAYGGVTSSGTFTHGHVGPGCLSELLRITRPGGLFVCGTVPAVFDGMGFGSRLAGLVAHEMITPVSFHDIALYEGVHHPNAADRGLVMVFRKL